MTLPTNDDFSNRELSIEDLEGIAAGSWLGDAWHAVSHGASVLLHDVGVAIKWVEDHWPKAPQGPYGSGTGLKAR
jgi:hypothetical protein